MLRVDCQTHVFPPAYAELLTACDGYLKVHREGDDYRACYGGFQEFLLSTASYDVEKKIRDMDTAGIDIGILSLNIPGPELLPPELGALGARVCNDYVAEVCRAHPGRFYGLAALPLQDVPSALDELRRATKELDFRGAVLYSNICGRPVDAPEFEPLYAMAERERIPLVIHPTVPPWGASFSDYHMIPMVGFMVDQSLAMLRLILGGVLERHPGLIVVQPHCGGVLPYLMPRIVEQTEVKKRGRENIRKSPAEYYAHVYLDVVSPSIETIKFAYDFAGPERLVFGTDHPWVQTVVFRDLLEGLPVPDSHKERIFGGNACTLFGIG